MSEFWAPTGSDGSPALTQGALPRRITARLAVAVLGRVCLVLVAGRDLPQAGLGHGELEVCPFIGQEDVAQGIELVGQAGDLAVSRRGSNGSFSQSVSP
jgi:hypothetical protein